MSFWQILAGAPWWVWVIFVYIIVVGIKAIRPRVVSLPRLLILPLVFAALSLHTLWQIPMNFSHVLIFIITALIGIGAGFWQISRLFIEIDRQQKLLALPGSPVTLILALVIFISKYYFGFAQATQPELLKNNTFLLSILALTGVCSGMFIGRAICYICRFVSLPHKDLKAS